MTLEGRQNGVGRESWTVVGAWGRSKWVAHLRDGHNNIMSLLPFPACCCGQNDSPAGWLKNGSIIKAFQAILTNEERQFRFFVPMVENTAQLDLKMIASDRTMLDMYQGDFTLTLQIQLVPGRTEKYFLVKNNRWLVYHHPPSKETPRNLKAKKQFDSTSQYEEYNKFTSDDQEDDSSNPDGNDMCTEKILKCQPSICSAGTPQRDMPLSESIHPTIQCME
eukprot:scaffold10205_cov52-Cyclotella_meneghiniana.AAC.11